MTRLSRLLRVCQAFPMLALLGGISPAPMPVPAAGASPAPQPTMVITPGTTAPLHPLGLNVAKTRAAIRSGLASQPHFAVSTTVPVSVDLSGNAPPVGDQ